MHSAPRVARMIPVDDKPCGAPCQDALRDLKRGFGEAATMDLVQPLKVNPANFQRCYQPVTKVDAVSHK